MRYALRLGLLYLAAALVGGLLALLLDGGRERNLLLGGWSIYSAAIALVLLLADGGASRFTGGRDGR